MVAEIIDLQELIVFTTYKDYFMLRVIKELLRIELNTLLNSIEMIKF